VTMKVGPKVAVLMTPFVLEGGRAGCKAERALKDEFSVMRKDLSSSHDLNGLFVEVL
jgi:hypothetical protein